MPLLLFEKITDTKAEVKLIHFRPDDPRDGVPEEIKNAGIMVDQLPQEPAPQRGKRNVLYCNPQTKDIWYEVVDRPLTPQEILEEQNEKINLLIQMQLERDGIV